MAKDRMTMDEYLKHLFKIANGYWMEGQDGARTYQAGIASLKNFLDHHACTGVFNGSLVWRRLPSYYNRGKKYRLVGQGAS